MEFDTIDAEILTKRATLQLDPKEHADVIIGACYGDLEAAWIWALENRKMNPDREAPYWLSVAEEIASRKPNPVEQ